METQKQKRAPTTHFDATPGDACIYQQKKKAKTASAQFKPPLRSGSQSSHYAAASPSAGSSVARSLSAKLAKAAAPKKK